MATKYYSGQGKLLVAERDGSGNPMGFTELGNIPSATLDIEIEKEEHKESQTGQRGVDLTIIKEKKGRMAITLENFDLEVMALGLHGTHAIVAGSSVTDENVTAYHDKPQPVVHPMTISSVVIQDVTDTTTYVLDTDYTLDTTYGTITALSTGSITDLEVLHVDYTYAGYTKLDVFTEATPIRWVRFQGVNTTDANNALIVDIYKASFDPITGYELITDEVGQVELAADVLFDDLRQSGSNYFTQYDLQ